MKYYGTGLYFNGQKIALNTRYIESGSSRNRSDTDARHRLFGYDINIGILSIHTIDLLKVNPSTPWNVDDHCHSFYELHIIPHGKGTITIDGTTFEVGSKQFYLTGPYVKHQQRSNPDDPMTEYCIQFEITIPSSPAASIPGYQGELNSYRNILGTSYPCSFADIYSVYDSFDQIFEEVERADIAYQLKVQTLISDILINVMRTVSKSMDIVARSNIFLNDEQSGRVTVIKNFVESNYSDKISIHDLKDILFLSTKQIDRIMLKDCGMTFHSYLSKYRYHAAKRLISTTDFSLNEIALMSGLSGEGHLHKVFKKFDVKSPGYYRMK